VNGQGEKRGKGGAPAPRGYISSDSLSEHVDQQLNKRLLATDRQNDIEQ